MISFLVQELISNLTQASNKSFLMEQAQVSQSVTKAGHTVMDIKRVKSAMVQGSKRQMGAKGRRKEESTP